MGTVDCIGQGVATGVTYNDNAIPGDRMNQAERAAWLRYRLASAGGSWGREFRLLLALADGCRVSLDTDALAFYDVRDLQALQRCLASSDASRDRLAARR